MLFKSRSSLGPRASTRALQLLLVESEPARVMNVVRLLELARPEWRVNVVRDREAASRALSEASFDAVLADCEALAGKQLKPGALVAALEDRVLAVSGERGARRAAS